MNNQTLMNAAISGLIALIFGLFFTWIASLIWPPLALTWAMIAVAFASFFAGVSGYVAGRERVGERRLNR